MTRKQLTGLQVGDEVTWVHPDSGEPLTCFVQEILTGNGYISDMDDALVITEGGQESYEICAYELQ